MLVDQRLDAQLSTMFMVEYQLGEWHTPTTIRLRSRILSSRAMWRRRRWQAGTFFAPVTCLDGVGCVHAFYNKSDRRVRWLETQAHKPPARLHTGSVAIGYLKESSRRRHGPWRGTRPDEAPRANNPPRARQSCRRLPRLTRVSSATAIASRCQLAAASNSPTSARAMATSREHPLSVVV